MRLRLFVLILATVAARSQPPQQQISCDAKACTFTLGFDDGLNNQGPAVAGAPYSGQESREQISTMDNGAHTTIKTSGPVTWRDSDGRTRTEQPVYPQRQRANGQSAPADDFTVVEIRDPVAGLRYILDPVTHIAHRMAFKPDPPEKWQPSYATEWALRNESLGTKAISGVAAVGYRTASTGTGFAGLKMKSFDERWVDPRTGVSLLWKHTDSSFEMTVTMLNYSNAEPDPALFRIPDGYSVIEETGPFKVVHPRKAPGPGAVSISNGQFGLTSSCDAGSCTITYNPPPQMFATTGAPYSGRDLIESPARTLADGTEIAARKSPGLPVYRDSNGSVWTEMRAPVRRPSGDDFKVVRIQDAVNGCEIILDSLNHVAHRVRIEVRTAPFHAPVQQPPRTNTLPNGTIFTDEDLGAQTISGVTAVGRRSTRTSPPGAFNGNDKTIVNVTEEWTDPKTGVVLISKNITPNGTTTRSIPDYKAGDPDPTLFLIPADYKIVDETGKFSFVIPR